MNPKREKKNCKYSEESMQAAVKAVLEEDKGVRAAAKLYNVPSTTLNNRLHGTRSMREASKHRVVLTPQDEERLVNWLMECARLGVGRTKGQVINQVQWELNSCGRVTSFRDNRPGDKWFRCFMARHPELKLQGIQQHRSHATKTKKAKGTASDDLGVETMVAEMAVEQLITKYDNTESQITEIGDVKQTQQMMTPSNISVTAAQMMTPNNVTATAAQMMTSDYTQVRVTDAGNVTVMPMAAPSDVSRTQVTGTYGVTATHMDYDTGTETTQTDNITVTQMMNSGADSGIEPTGINDGVKAAPASDNHIYLPPLVFDSLPQKECPSSSSSSHIPTFLRYKNKIAKAQSLCPEASHSQSSPDSRAPSKGIHGMSVQTVLDRLLDVAAKAGIEKLVHYRAMLALNLPSDDPEEQVFKLLYDRMTKEITSVKHVNVSKSNNKQTTKGQSKAKMTKITKNVGSGWKGRPKIQKKISGKMKKGDQEDKKSNGITEEVNETRRGLKRRKVDS